MARRVEREEAVTRHNLDCGQPQSIAEPARQEQCDLRFVWVEAGEVTLDTDEKLSFPDVSRHPGLYRFRVEHDGDDLIYIGETEEFKRRFSHYRNPGPSQTTNIRLNKLFRDASQEGRRVFVSVVIDTAWVSTQGVERRADFSVKAERVLLEHAAIVRAKSEGLDVLNK